MFLSITLCLAALFQWQEGSASLIANNKITLRSVVMESLVGTPTTLSLTGNVAVTGTVKVGGVDFSERTTKAYRMRMGGTNTLPSVNGAVSFQGTTHEHNSNGLISDVSGTWTISAPATTSLTFVFTGQCRIVSASNNDARWDLQFYSTTDSAYIGATASLATATHSSADQGPGGSAKAFVNVAAGATHNVQLRVQYKYNSHTGNCHPTSSYISVHTL